MINVKTFRIIVQESQKTSNWWLAQRRGFCEALPGGHSSVGEFFFWEVPSSKSSMGRILGEIAQHCLLERASSQALRMVRSLDEIKEELRGLTVKVDGQEDTVAGLLETGRWFSFTDPDNKTKVKFTVQTINWYLCVHRLFMADYSSLATLPLVPGRVFYAPQVKQQSCFMLPERSHIWPFFQRCFWPGLQQET